MSNISGKKYETYTQAVEAACQGEQEAFTFLYESTYRDKHFIAWKYMRREEDAQDVLQDAYMKAWENLPTLKEPEKFPGWLSMIVANTALNALNKKKPLPFSALEQTTEEGDTFEFEEEDWRKEYQPEHAYTDKETSELLKEMLDSLSDEQRFCMLMHYVEEIPTNQIAEMIGCTKNTVTSRLNYGRKNLKAKAEELEKKGYSLYSIAPLPLLLLLLRTQAKTAQVAIPALNTAEAASLAMSGGSAGSAAAPAASTAATTGTASTGASSASASGTTASAGAATASVTAATAAATAAAGMALGTKIAIGAVILALLGGGGLAAARLLSSDAEEEAVGESVSTTDEEIVAEVVAQNSETITEKNTGETDSSTAVNTELRTETESEAISQEVLYASYADVIRELEDTYGVLSVVEVEREDGEGFPGYSVAVIEGLSFLSLADMDGDGVEELVTVYRDTGAGDLTLAVYSMQDGTVACVYEDPEIEYTEYRLSSRGQKALMGDLYLGIVELEGLPCIFVEGSSGGDGWINHCYLFRDEKIQRIELNDFIRMFGHVYVDWFQKGVLIVGESSFSFDDLANNSSIALTSEITNVKKTLGMTD